MNPHKTTLGTPGFSITRAQIERARAYLSIVELDFCRPMAAGPGGYLPFRGVSFADGTSTSERVQPVYPVSLLITDDHEIVRRGLRALIHEQLGWQVVAEVIDGREAEEFKLDVAILDITMPPLNGLEATREIA